MMDSSFHLGTGGGSSWLDSVGEFRVQSHAVALRRVKALTFVAVFAERHGGTGGARLCFRLEGVERRPEGTNLMSTIASKTSKETRKTAGLTHPSIHRVIEIIIHSDYRNLPRLNYFKN